MIYWFYYASTNFSFGTYITYRSGVLGTGQTWKNGSVICFMIPLKVISTRDSTPLSVCAISDLPFHSLVKSDEKATWMNEHICLHKTCILQACIQYSWQPTNACVLQLLYVIKSNMFMTIATILMTATLIGKIIHHGWYDGTSTSIHHFHLHMTGCLMAFPQYYEVARLCQEYTACWKQCCNMLQFKVSLNST